MKNADFDQAGWREGARAVNAKENFSQSRRRSVGLTRANSAFSPSSLDLDLESPPPSFTSFFSPLFTFRLRFVRIPHGFRTDGGVRPIREDRRKGEKRNSFLGLQTVWESE